MKRILSIGAFGLALTALAIGLGANVPPQTVVAQGIANVPSPLPTDILRVISGGLSGYSLITQVLTPSRWGCATASDCTASSTLLNSQAVSLPALKVTALATSAAVVCTDSSSALTTSGCGSGGVTGVTGSGNIAVTAGATPNVTITNAPVFTGSVKAAATGFGTGSFLPPAYTAAGAVVANTEHIDHGTCAFSSADHCNITFTNLTWTSATSYSCSASQGAATQQVYTLLVGNQTTSTMTIYTVPTTSDTVTVTWSCEGT